MSEKPAHPTPERSPEKITAFTPEKEAPAKSAVAEKEETRQHDHNLDKIQASIHEEAISGKDVSVEQHSADAQPVLGMQRELKAAAYQKTLRRVQTRLNPAERSISKVVHQPLVESVSEVGAKTVARPSGILGGGIISLIGSAVVLYMAKHYGFEYSYFVFIALFLVGFLVGSILELLVRAIKRA